MLILLIHKMETQSTDDYEVNIEDGVIKKIKKLKKRVKRLEKTVESLTKLVNLSIAFFPDSKPNFKPFG